MSKNIFFEQKGPFLINKLFPNNLLKNKIKIKDIKTLDKASKEDLTFFDSINYKDLAINTKASFCITTDKLKEYLPENCEKIIVKNVLYELAKVTSMFYPKANIDFPDFNLKKPNKTKFKSVKFCNNVLIGKNVQIGKNTIVGSNTIIESNVKIGKNCVITAQVGFAGSAVIGNKVSIGGQAGISGHLNIGNNVQIGGGSGVINNVPDNTKIMGYPAKNIRKFLKEGR